LDPFADCFDNGNVVIRENSGSSASAIEAGDPKATPVIPIQRTVGPFDHAAGRVPAAMCRCNFLSGVAKIRCAQILNIVDPTNGDPASFVKGRWIPGFAGMP